MKEEPQQAKSESNRTLPTKSKQKKMLLDMGSNHGLPDGHIRAPRNDQKNIRFVCNSLTLYQLSYPGGSNA
jgi:hypothetical protein